MAGAALPTNIDTTYPDDGTDASVKLHQQYHDTIHGVVNALDTGLATATAGQVLAFGGAVYAPVAPVMLSSSVPKTGDWLMVASASTGNVSIPNQYEWRGGPMMLPAGSWDRVQVAVNNAGTTGCQAKVVIYGDAAGRPGSVLFDSASFAADATGISALTVATPFATNGRDPIWVGIVNMSAPATQPQFAFVINGAMLPYVSIAAPTIYYSSTTQTWGASLASGVAAANPTMLDKSISGYPRCAFRRA